MRIFFRRLMRTVSSGKGRILRRLVGWERGYSHIIFSAKRTQSLGFQSLCTFLLSGTIRDKTSPLHLRQSRATISWLFLWSWSSCMLEPVLWRIFADGTTVQLASELRLKRNSSNWLASRLISWFPCVFSTRQFESSCPWLIDFQTSKQGFRKMLLVKKFWSEMKAIWHVARMGHKEWANCVFLDFAKNAPIMQLGAKLVATQRDADWRRRG